jgi:hypothetical protein
VARRTEQSKKEKQVAKTAALVQVREDAITLLRSLNVTQAKKAYTVTRERLTEILGSPVPARLECLVEANYLTAAWGPNSEYELNFLARSLELLPAEGQGRPKKRLDPRNRRGARTLR